ncbi:energy transducer TonB [Fibrella aquatilis]|uniref:TonB C-terminal domain-containing protein n=1 Tax=Fibrella aquatilis TaxID=2817059 RepID=A0A939GAA0_9BACT|nr:energy transducer TonB [Fibrella aquatilis]MBO0932931.1 hypothetical protein [Fibrella aquatilis]
MKSSFLFLRWLRTLANIACLATLSLTATAQKMPKQTYPGRYYTSVEKLAEFPGGRDAMLRFMADHIEYPSALDRMKYKTGPMKVRFIVAPDGKLYDITVDSAPVRKVEAQRGMDDYIISIIHAIEIMPRWQPARLNGQPVAQLYTVPIQVVE